VHACGQLAPGVAELNVELVEAVLHLRHRLHVCGDWRTDFSCCSDHERRLPAGDEHAARNENSDDDDESEATASGRSARPGLGRCLLGRCGPRFGRFRGLGRCALRFFCGRCGLGRCLL